MYLVAYTFKKKTIDNIYAKRNYVYTKRTSIFMKLETITISDPPIYIFCFLNIFITL